MTKEDEIFRILEEKYELHEIRHIVRDIIKTCISELKNEKRRFERWSEEEEEKVKEMYELGYPITEIAKDLQRPPVSVRSRIHWFISQHILDINSFKERMENSGYGEKTYQKKELEMWRRHCGDFKEVMSLIKKREEAKEHDT